MNRAFFTIVVMSTPFIASVVYADFIPEEWLYSKDITIPAGITEDTLIGVELDNEVFANAKKNFGDLRIIDEGGTEIPYVLRSETTKQNIVSYSPQMLNLSYVTGSHTTFIADFGGNVAHNKIEILTSSKNFRRQVTISGSNDKVNWQTIKENEEIYDYTLEFQAKNTQISYPESIYRYVLVKIDDSEQQQLDISGVRAQQIETRRAKKVSYEPKVWQVEDEKNKQTIITLDLGQRGLETDTAILSIDSKNFERYVTVSGSDDLKHWSHIDSDMLYSYQTSKVHSSKSILYYGAVNKRYFRFVINNYDNQPIVIGNDIVLQGLAHSILFLANPDTAYGLYYGYDKGFTSKYDFESVYRHFDEDEIVRGELGIQDISALYVVPVEEPEPEKVLPWTENMPWVLPLVYTVMGGLLVFMMMNIYRRTTPVAIGQKDDSSSDE